jgi:purine-nucleoside phosphorylase
MKAQYKEAYDYIRSRTKERCEVGIILGTGLGGLVKNIMKPCSIDYRDIPHFPVSTVESHSGNLIFGKLSGKNIVAMQGRFHYYEGYSHERIVFPVHIMKLLGVKNMIVSNACGAINPKMHKTDLVIMSSHINLHFSSPLITPAGPDIGQDSDGRNKFPMAKSARYFYDKRLIELAEQTALENKIEIKKGTYASVQGPNLETKAEYRMMKVLTADIVGMSTIPEVLAAKKLGIKTFGLSIVTDEGFPDTLKVAELKHILESAAIAEPKMVALIEKLVPKL